MRRREEIWCMQFAEEAGEALGVDLPGCED